MSKNRGVVHTKPGEVRVQDIADPKFENPRGRKKGLLKWESTQGEGTAA
jgi:hypothetical protein